MNDWSPTPDDPDAELQLADNLIGKADALLRRHRSTEPLTRATDDTDDLPILTDIVVDFDDSIPLLSERENLQHGHLPPPSTSLHEQDQARITEHLVQIHTLISREVEAWLSSELPQLLSREIDALSTRLRVETLAHLKATLLPELSRHISKRLDELSK